MCGGLDDPLTRPAPADENAVAGHPLPQGGEGWLIIFMVSGCRGRYDRLPTPYCPLPSAFCFLPSAFCLLPTAYCLLPTAFFFLPFPHPRPKRFEPVDIVAHRFDGGGDGHCQDQSKTSP